MTFLFTTIVLYDRGTSTSTVLNIIECFNIEDDDTGKTDYS